MQDLIVYLLAILIVVPISKRVGLGSVIGYLIAGALLGPQGLALLFPGEKGTSQVAEFGIIMMLLLIGLELNPRILWKMRGPIFGLGSIQVVGTIFLFALGTFLLDMPIATAITIGMILSASSTAIVIQTLQEQGYAKTTGGERAFSVLLFQDMAVIPILALLPLLGSGPTTTTTADALKHAALVLGAVAALIAIGRLVISHVFQFIARTKLREAFTALALFIVVAAAELMHAVGVSPALGAFIAGVVLANSEFKHQIEADIEPFKGLLLGLFFITIGSSIQFDLIAQKPLTVILWIGAIIFGKALLVYILGRASKMRPPESLLFAFSLAQGGEFAFVLITQAGGILSTETAQILTASIALSMALAPLLIKLTIKKGMTRFDCYSSEAENQPKPNDTSQISAQEKESPVLIIGIGRFGQTLFRFLRANGFPCTVLDIDSEQIEVMGKFGIKAYFGDGANIDLLRAAGIEKAKAIVLALDEQETALKIAETVRQNFPNLPIFARVYDRIHAYKMLHLGVKEVAIETSGSSLVLGTEVMTVLGVKPEVAAKRAQLFHVNNHRSIRALSKRFHTEDRESFIQASRLMAEQLDALFSSDSTELSQGAASEWTPDSKTQ